MSGNAGRADRFPAPRRGRGIGPARRSISRGISEPTAQATATGRLKQSKPTIPPPDIELKDAAAISPWFGRELATRAPHPALASSQGGWNVRCV